MASIKKDLLSGVFYISLAKYSGIIVQIVITSVLARLILPSEFGVVSIATVIIFFIKVIADLGMGPAIIQNKSLSVDDFKSLFSIYLIVGTVLSISFYFLSSPISIYYDSVELVGICRWMSLIVFFNTISSFFESLLLREKRFKFLSIRSFVVQLITGAIAIIAASRGMGGYALVLQSISSSVIIFIINYHQFKLFPHFSNIYYTFSKIKSFSIFQFAFNIINYFTRNLDKLLIGKYLGTDMLGYYDKSYRLMMLPLQSLTDVVSPVLLPIFSQKDVNREKMISSYLKILEVLAFISLPLSAFLFFTSREIIQIFFGPNWDMSILPFKILSLSVSIQVLNSTTGSIYQAVNYAKGLMYCGVVGATLIGGSFFITIFGWRTLSAVSVGFDIGLFAAAAYSFGLLFKKIGVRLNSFFKILTKPFILFILLFILLFIYDSSIEITSIWLSLLIKILISILTFVFYITIFTNYSLNTIISILKRKK